MNRGTALAALVTSGILFLGILAGCSGEVEVPDLAYEPVPELFEREILPVTAALPTAACVVPRYSPDSDPVTTDHLVVGMADGRIASFHGAGGGMVGVTSFGVSPGRAIDDVAVYRDPRAGGLGTEHVVLALHGRRLTALSLETMSPLGTLDLPNPEGTWKLHVIGGRGQDGSQKRPGRVVLGDDVSLHMLERHPGSTFELGLREILRPGGRLALTALSDRLVAVGRDSVWTVDGTGRPSAARLRRSGSDDAGGGRCALGRSDAPDRLVFCSRTDDGSWVERSVALPGSLTTAMTVSDSMILAGGSMYQIPEHRIGWLTLVDARGRVPAESDHPSPVVLLAEVGGFLAAQGEDRNLSVYDRTLLPLWDRASQVQPVALLPCHFNPDASADLAVVSSRLYSLEKTHADMLHEAIGDWAFMDGAELVPSPVEDRQPRYENTLPHIAFFSGNEMRLRGLLSSLTDQSRKAELDRRYGQSVATAVRARAAAAALGDIATARELTVRLAELLSLPRRMNAGLLAAILLGAAGASVALLYLRDDRPSVWYGAALVAVAAISVAILRSPPWSWTMFLGGGVAVAASVSGWAGSRYVSVVTSPKRRAGAPIEELLIGIAEFKHGGGEGGSDEGRKSVTRLAYLAQEMLDSLDDGERYSMLRDRLALRAKSYLHSKHQLTGLLMEHARAAGIARDEVRSMVEAADRIREGVESVLGEEGEPASGTEASLVAAKNGRDELVRAADRAWGAVRENPGCSVSAAVQRILDSMREELESADVSVQKDLRVPESRDAVALWSGELDFVLENLLSNAVRYMDRSGERKVLISGRDGGAFYELRISDRGTARRSS